MTEIIISQQGISHILHVPDGSIERIESPNGGYLNLNQPIRIIAINSSKVPDALKDIPQIFEVNVNPPLEAAQDETEFTDED